MRSYRALPKRDVLMLDEFGETKMFQQAPNKNLSVWREWSDQVCVRAAESIGILYVHATRRKWLASHVHPIKHLSSITRIFATKDMSVTTEYINLPSQS